MSLGVEFRYFLAGVEVALWKFWHGTIFHWRFIPDCIADDFRTEKKCKES